MMTIWKFPFEPRDGVVIEMPKGARPLCVAMQHDQPCLWAMVDPTAPTEPREFRLAGTGHDLPDVLRNVRYIGTFQMHGGALVFHLFDPYAQEPRE